jgi:hypothetical protein
MTTTPFTGSLNIAAGQDDISADPVRIQARHRAVKKLGRWTTARRFEVRAQRGTALLDLRSPEIPAGDIEIRLDLDHSMVKLLLPEDAVVDHWDLRIVGRGRVKDWQQPASTAQEPAGTGQGSVATGQGSAATGQGRRVRLTGDIRQGEVRISRGGVAILTAMFSREYLADARRARAEGRYPTIDDPSRTDTPAARKPRP